MALPFTDADIERLHYFKAGARLRISGGHNEETLRRWMDSNNLTAAQREATELGYRTAHERNARSLRDCEVVGRGLKRPPGR